MRHFRDSTIEILRKHLSAYPWIYALFSMGAILRIAGFTVGRLWYDELFSLAMTRQALFTMVNALKVNLTPPGWEVLMWFVVRVLGRNAFGLRLPSVLASIATLWIVHQFGVSLKFTRGQLIATMAVVSLLPYQLVYAQTGRVYALFAFFYLLGVLAALLGRWLVLGISAAALLWCHIASLAFIPALFVIAVFVHPAKWKKILLIFVMSGLLYAPWLGWTLSRASTLVPWFAPLTPDLFIGESIAALFGVHLPIWAWIIVLIQGLILIPLVLLSPIVKWILLDMRKDMAALAASQGNAKTWFASMARRAIGSTDSRSQRQAKWILFFAFGAPLSLLTLASILAQNVLYARTVYFLSIPFVMWIIASYVVPRPTGFHRITWGLSLLVLAAGVISWAPTQLDGGFAGLQNTVAMGFQDMKVSYSGRVYRRGDAFLHDTGWSAIVFEYYFPDKRNYLMDGRNVVGLRDVLVTQSSIRQAAPETISAQRLWIVHAVDASMETVNKTAYKQAEQLIREYDCPLVGYIAYPQDGTFGVFICDTGQR